MGEVLQFPKHQWQQKLREIKKGMCPDCEWSGRVIVTTKDLRSYVFRCICSEGDQWKSFPRFDKNRLGFNNARAAR